MTTDTDDTLVTDETIDPDPADLWPLVAAFPMGMPIHALPVQVANHLPSLVCWVIQSEPPPRIAQLGYGPMTLMLVGDPVLCPCGCGVVTFPVAPGALA